jgi:sterol 3beta-glucosyltransferase
MLLHSVPENSKKHLEYFDPLKHIQIGWHMKIGLQTWGSDGDVRPFIALAGGLSASGHEVTLVITSHFCKDYTDYGDFLNFKIIHVQETYKTEEILKDDNPLKITKNMGKAFMLPAIDEMYEASKKLCAENDIVIGHYLIYPLQTAALKQSRPYVYVHFFPGMIPSNFTTPPLTISLGSWSNPWWWKLAKYLINKVALDDANSLRHREGIPNANDTIEGLWLSNNLTLIPSSPTLYKRPSDWNKNIQLCGFWAVQEKAEEWIMPDALKQFLNSGTAPIYITFGVVAPMAAQNTIDLLIEAVNLSGCRAIIQASWNTLTHIPENPHIYRMNLGQVPHSKIFPSCALVVHHGGAGTSHSATLSGCPSIIIEHFGDQYFWGTVLEKIGLAHYPLRRRSLTSKTLSKAIKKVITSPGMKKNALNISKKMHEEEDGVARAVTLIEEHFSL